MSPPFLGWWWSLVRLSCGRRRPWAIGWRPGWAWAGTSALPIRSPNRGVWDGGSQTRWTARRSRSRGCSTCSWCTRWTWQPGSTKARSRSTNQIASWSIRHLGPIRSILNLQKIIFWIQMIAGRYDWLTCRTSSNSSVNVHAHRTHSQTPGVFGLPSSWQFVNKKKLKSPM